MIHKHEKITSSKFKVVNQYENHFIKEFNKNLSMAVADVLKYVARATASYINENK